MSDVVKVGEVITNRVKGNPRGEVLKGTRGGARPGGGRPKGVQSQATLEKTRIKEAFNQRVLQNADKLFNAQMQLAVGEQSLYVKITEPNPDGKGFKSYHELVTDQKLIKQYLDYGEGFDDVESPNDGTHYYYLSTKPANNMAIDSLLNRALGKAPDKLELEGGFFNQTQITIKVVGSQHDNISFGDDGQIKFIEHEPDAIGEAGLSDSTAQPPASS